jgi:hypothetical protein
VLDLLKPSEPKSGMDLVFTNRQGGRLLIIREGFSTACKRAGLEDLHFHDLRHTFASHWMMNGGDLYALKDILGHKSITMTQRYAHLSPEFKRSAMNRMNDIWANTGHHSEMCSEMSPVTGRSAATGGYARSQLGRRSRRSVGLGVGGLQGRCNYAVGF